MEPVRGGMYGMGASGAGPAQGGPPPAMPMGDVRDILIHDPNVNLSRELLINRPARELEEQETKTSRWWWLGGLVAAALAAGVGIALWMRHKKKKEEGEHKKLARKTANRKGNYYTGGSGSRKANPGARKKPGKKRNRTARLPSSEYRLKPSMIVQTLIFPKDKFERAAAVAWARKHKYETSKVDETGSSWRIRQKIPGRMGPKTFRTIAFGDSGIKAVVAKAKAYKEAA